MIDGLALGETTPGPLIMVVTFFNFLPSFVFILAGGPVVEATHGGLGSTAPLSAITAAVVGVILNLAMFFAFHVLWPQGFGGRFDGLSAVITGAAVLARFRFKVGVLPLLGACAGIGLIASWLVPLLR
jgi:chromate transporter